MTDLHPSSTTDHNEFHSSSDISSTISPSSSTQSLEEILTRHHTKHTKHSQQNKQATLRKRIQNKEEQKQEQKENSIETTTTNSSSTPSSSTTSPLLKPSDLPNPDLDPSLHECRVCHLGHTVDNPLYSPCHCKGSIKWIHQSCLTQWLAVRGKQSCDLCHYQFHFQPIYAEQTPDKATWIDIVLGCATLAKKFIPKSIRWCIVSACWLFIVPLVTYYLFRFSLWFSSPSIPFPTLSTSASVLLYHSQIGLFLCFILFISSLLGFSLRELIREEVVVAEFLQNNEINIQIRPDQVEQIVEALEEAVRMEEEGGEEDDDEDEEEDEDCKYLKHFVYLFVLLFVRVLIASVVGLSLLSCSF